MIIFSLDGTLADCEHRRHFIQKPWDYCHKCYEILTRVNPINQKCECGRDPINWEEDWKAFYEACDKDLPIKPTLDLIEGFIFTTDQFQVWSGRCESVIDKTIKWLSWEIPTTMNWGNGKWENHLKMRPIGDSTPEYQLKERWLEETYEDYKWGPRTPIDFVFDSDPESVKMWRSRGYFVFDVNQSGQEF